ncbi:LSU ribosomal protein L13Ae (L13p) [Candidatus Methanomethylophilus alvi Mx1201]|jgi:large subunit ribosomal protein L13|uniref:Large ribosomal subunit protein uL13 n=2 Tax=Methanomethylophilus alvi TaxID=1291540 RepID=M9SD28_METAX|nr:50S ribosomal protein L13 [Methanomethylophilus alvi]CDF30345.1 50S ribosomal protein L13P [Methanoculleus sp. CAG:1088]AGI86201.1 LSU ribosomal protein L13Ae (L13p) [Candidatus Methanomethylophilus alvi Mx1201]AYQ55572.1 50S ribosomal protein L13 [Methanomethylophilus alvi]MCI5973657.1 50S ribosomal protein L13 [Methanomethylophilus alvi]MDD7480126.1 50S ribosomal protein L13 [Methanomethylophilus alvi]
MVTVIDGKGLIYGRLASNVAEMIMAGEEVVVLNAEQIIITGERSEILKDFKNKVDRGDVSKRKGPFYPRRSDLLFKRCVRGMIPWMSSSGRDAFRRLHVFVGAPKQFEDSNKVRPEEADRAVTCKYVTLGEISEFLGSKVR